LIQLDRTLLQFWLWLCLLHTCLSYATYLPSRSLYVSSR
jgi:hypothetical protein